MSCCTNTYNLGCFSNCIVVTFLSAPETETITVVYEFAGIKQQQDFDALQGESIYLYLNTLNENASYSLSFYNSSGNKLLFEIADVSYDCFTFTTNIWSRMRGDFNDDFNDDFNNQQ